ncbi:glutaredoxin family protein [Mycolicibacterium palauense]|uniref:glutaredoxin family protein n=1 Tax=Mycolicibacterium palauense TaxID=2034511 RepID=UPI000BFEC6E5|nr:glutaredoxin family protein [Mycolicibacterium palauense]
MTVTVFTTGPNCHKCNLTKSQLTRGGVMFTEVRIDQDHEAAAALKARGFEVAPVVHVAETDDWWGDFRIDKIRELTQAVPVAA